jgi:hypothetical protein
MTLPELIRLGLTVPKPAKAKWTDVDVPVAPMTPAEREFADAVIRQHFSEDRNEITDGLTTRIAERIKANRPSNSKL